MKTIYKKRGYYNMDFTGLFIILLAIGAAIGVCLAVILPILWDWLKPIIHAWTA